MRVRARLLSGGVSEKELDVPEDATYEALLLQLGISPEIAVILKNGRPVPLDEQVSGDDIDVLRVVTGG